MFIAIFYYFRNVAKLHLPQMPNLIMIVNQLECIIIAKRSNYCRYFCGYNTVKTHCCHASFDSFNLEPKATY